MIDTTSKTPITTDWLEKHGFIRRPADGNRWELSVVDKSQQIVVYMPNGATTYWEWANCLTLGELTVERLLALWFAATGAKIQGG